MHEAAEGGGEGEERVGDKGLVSAVSARLLLTRCRGGREGERARGRVGETERIARERDGELPCGPGPRRRVVEAACDVEEGARRTRRARRRRRRGCSAGRSGRERGTSPAPGRTCGRGMLGQPLRRAQKERERKRDARHARRRLVDEDDVASRRGRPDEGLVRRQVKVVRCETSVRRRREEASATS